MFDLQETTLTGQIIGCAMKVHRVLGPGFKEMIYRNALVVELKRAGLEVVVERAFVVMYEGQEVGEHRADIIVRGRVVVELETVWELDASHYAQTLSYLRATGCKVGLLFNFARQELKFRRVRPAESPSL